MSSTTDCRWIDVSPDYRKRLQGFKCAAPLKGGDSIYAVKKHGIYYAPWELEVQTTIRDFRKCRHPESEWAHICVSPGISGDDRIFSFVWFGIIGGTKHDANGSYVIGYIARSLDAEGCGFGDFTLKHALHVLKEDHERTGREDAVGARIDPMNSASMALFERNGFMDMGEDPEATEYHRWMRFGFSGID